MKIPANWKPIAVGLFSVILAAVQASSYRGDWISALKDRGVQLSIAMGILGLVSKQSNVTGGTVGQPSTPEALTAANQAHSEINPPAPKG